MASKSIDTTLNAVPFHANIPGPKSAKAIKPIVAGKLISKAKRPLLVVGSDILRNQSILEKAIKIGEKGIPIAATGDSLKGFLEYSKNLKVQIKYINLNALVSYLGDREWKGFDNKGNYDLIIFLANKYYYASQLMSLLKNFSKVKTISIDRYYYPNADMSFGNLKEEDFLQALDEMIDAIKG
ncbi:MAG TPA: CO dehydrogenase/acetyl-CoA synthase complex subunit epsilon [Methanosarcinales archaeon]|nr:CO dehydrogenase/acetyl-CoA synthase complex subunit epsilon [Methanosarcinales archaeon]